jgi:hypothetical protein
MAVKKLFTTNFIEREGLSYVKRRDAPVFAKDVSKSDLAIFTIVSVALTIPFIFYARDIADSLRYIADKKYPML